MLKIRNKRSMSEAGMEVFEPSLLTSEMHIYARNIRIRNCSFYQVLPNELFLRILKFVSKKQLFQLSLVSKFFYSLVFDGSLWSCLDLSNDLQNIPDAVLVKILRKSNSCIKKLVLRNYNELSDKVVLEIIQNCTNLQVLDIKGCNRFRKMDLINLLLRNRNLKQIYLNGIQGIDNEIMEALEDLNSIDLLSLSYCKGQFNPIPLQLVHLDLNGINQIEFSVFRHLNRMENLKELNLSRMELNNNMIEMVFNEETRFQLNRLNLSFIKHIDDITNIIRFQNNINWLNLSNLDLSEDNLLDIVSKFKLYYLNLDNIATVTNEVLTKLIECNDQIKYLILNNTDITNEDVISLKYTKLIHLEIANCKYISDNIFMHLSFHLRYLDLLDCNISESQIVLLSFYQPELKINSVYGKLNKANTSSYSCNIL